MERPIQSVDIVSDGILVRFSDGVLSYFPHQFLREYIGVGSNQLFLDGAPHSSPESRLHLGRRGLKHLVS